MNRNTSVRDKHRRQIAADRPCCWICGEPIDWQARYPEPLSFVVDHVIPIAKGGSETDIANCRPAHQKCNRDKSDRLDGGPIIRRSGSLARPQGG